MNPDQDPVVARALADMDVPDHGPGFWEKLDRRLERAARAEAAGLRPVEQDGVDQIRAETEPAPTHVSFPDDESAGVTGRGSRVDEPVDRRTSTGELPSVAELRPPAPASRRHKTWFVGAAAALVVAIAAAALLAGRDDPETNQAAGDGVSTTTRADAPLSTDSSTGSTTPATPTAAAGPSPETTVTEWLRAVGDGDVSAAAALTGPRSAEYWASRGSEESLEDALRNSVDGYGSMAEAPDLELEEIPIGTYEFGDVALVAVTGTFTAAEGGTGRTTFVFPVVTDGGGSVVEPWAWSPEAGGALQFTAPDVSEAGPGVMEPDGAIELFAPVEGVVWFRLDDGADGIRPDETSPVAGAPFARYDPPGDLAPGEHLAIVGFMSADGAVIVAEAVPFEVS